MRFDTISQLFLSFSLPTILPRRPPMFPGINAGSCGAVAVTTLGFIALAVPAKIIAARDRGIPMRFLWNRPGNCIAFLWPKIDIDSAINAGGFIVSDLIFLALGAGGFLVCYGFVRLCDRL